MSHKPSAVVDRRAARRTCDGTRRVGERAAESGEGPMLRDAHRSRRGTDRSRGLLRRHPERHPEHEDLALRVGQLVEQPAQLAGQLGAQRVLLGPLGRVRRVGDLDVEIPAAPGGRPVRVDHLVRGDAVHERQERLALEPVPGQARQHGETHLLRDVVRGRPARRTQPGTAVAHDVRPDRGQQPPHRVLIPGRRLPDELVRDVVRLTGGAEALGHAPTLALPGIRADQEGPGDPAQGTGASGSGLLGPAAGVFAEPAASSPRRSPLRRVRRVCEVRGQTLDTGRQRLTV